MNTMYFTALTIKHKLPMMSITLFKKSSKYSEFHNENYDSRFYGTSRKSNTLNYQELEKFGILIDKSDSVFSGAALNLILDNIASPFDITNILETDTNRLKCKYLFTLSKQ